MYIINKGSYVNKVYLIKYYEYKDIMRGLRVIGNLVNKYMLCNSLTSRTRCTLTFVFTYGSNCLSSRSLKAHNFHVNIIPSTCMFNMYIYMLDLSLINILKNILFRVLNRFQNISIDQNFK